MPRLSPTISATLAATPASSALRTPPVSPAAGDTIATAKVALALGQLTQVGRLLEPVLASPATPSTTEGFLVAADAALEARLIPESRDLIRRVATECGFRADDCNALKPGTDYTAAQLAFDAGILSAQAACALGEAPAPVWFHQAIYSPDGVFCLTDQLNRRLIAFDSAGHVLWGKQLPHRVPVVSKTPAPSLLLSQRPDEGLSYIDNQYRDFARMNRFAAYQTLTPLGAGNHTFGSFTQDFFGNVYATCTDRETIAIYTEDGTQIKEIRLPDIDIAKPEIPYAILGDDEGHIYLYDTQMLLVLDRYGHVLFRHEFPTAPIPALLSQGLPGGMHLTADGHLWLARPTEGRIVKVHPERTGILAEIGPNLPGVPLISPVDIIADWSDQLYIVDAGAGRVLRVNHAATEVTVLFERPWWTGIALAPVSPTPATRA